MIDRDYEDIKFRGGEDESFFFKSKEGSVKADGKT